MNIFKSRRNKLLEKILCRSLIFIFSGSLKKQSEDSDYPFFVNRNFYYLSNLSQENSIIILCKDKNNKVNEYLFIDGKDEKMDKYFGEKININEAKKVTNIDNVFFNSEFNLKIKSILSIFSIKNIYVDLHNLFENKVFSFLNENNNLNIIDIYPLICDLRVIKDKNEINNIEQAIKITKLGLEVIIEKLKKHSDNEIEIFNAFNEKILNLGTHEIAFPSIIASGKNACCLHYPKPFDKIDKNSLILCDVGASYGHYCADVTRVFPVNGKFSQYQKKIYQIVLNCNKKIISMIKPGKTMFEIQELTKKFLAEQCLKEKIIEKLSDIKNYYFHNISHHLGLDVHDVGDIDKKFKPGMVITVEPGLYIQEKKIGIRIEDDVLITKNGCECLTKFIPKEIKDVEQKFL